MSIVAYEILKQLMGAQPIADGAPRLGAPGELLADEVRPIYVAAGM